MGNYRVWLLNDAKECKSVSVEAANWQEAAEKAERESNGCQTWAVESKENTISLFKWATVSTNKKDK